ncbi:hypothetical protein SLS53_001313 [Cytospora paraplurivora]|uniref:Amino acid transporter transmembrane domain-containing protein n=1 Tax=Cytospora paraplurivora TaxID=2898453 RepID=A0AAN9UHR0_9PEZI
MAEARSQHAAGHHQSGVEPASTRDPEAEALLFDDEASSIGEDDYNNHNNATNNKKEEAATTRIAENGSTRPTPMRVQSALRAPTTTTTSTAGHQRRPHTPPRVRFDPNPQILHGMTPNAYANNNSFDGGSRRRSSSSDLDRGRDSSLDELDFQIDDGAHGGEHRTPLLTGIEAPSVAVANGAWGGEHGGDVQSWAEGERQRPKSGLRSAFMNMANSIIGAGIIGQPYAFKQAGLLSGIVLLVGLTVIVDWTICLIVVNSKLSGANSFQGTVEHCFGRSGLVAISLAQWLFAFGGMVAFGVIVGDTIPHVLQAILPGLKDMPVLWILADRKAVIGYREGKTTPLQPPGPVLLPCVQEADLRGKLAKASTLALISMVVIIITVLTQSVLTPAAERGSFTTPLLTVNTGIFQAIGVISFAFVCHHNSLLIYGSLKTPTIDRFSRVTHYSTGVSMLACMLMALAGFLTFGDKTLGNVLNNFPSDNTMVTVARLCFGLNMLTTLPLEAFVCREVMLNYYFPNEPFNMNLHLIFSTSLVVSAMALSVMTCDLGSVFELVGATSACAMAYILPPLCYIKLTSRSWKTYVAVGIVIFGCCVMVISTFQAVGKIIKGLSPVYVL